MQFHHGTSSFELGRELHVGRSDRSNVFLVGYVYAFCGITGSTP